MAFVKNYEQLVVARFFLGVAEAGLLPVNDIFQILPLNANALPGSYVLPFAVVSPKILRPAHGPLYQRLYNGWCLRRHSRVCHSKDGGVRPHIS